MAPFPVRSERFVAAWLGSLAMHLTVLLGLLLIVAPSMRPAGETLEFVLPGSDEPIDTAATLAEIASDPDPFAETTGSLPLLASVTVSLPARPTNGGATESEATRAAAGGTHPSTATPSEGRRTGPADFRFGYGHTQLFGVAGEGFRFVYVFDRSGSMGGSGRSALEIAKAELLASLEPLESTHQFQIVFYNELPHTFSIAGKPGRLVFANEGNKRSAAEYIRSVSATGSTRHEEALAAALAYFPDVVYFLTDADDPAMTEAELARITRLNGDRSVIHAIEFGLGPAGHRENFLTRLAQQNGGQHVYVDFSTWRPDRRAGVPAPPKQ